MKLKIIPIVKITLGLLSLLMLSIGCKKEDKNPWEWCNPCQTDLIFGDYEGKATHYKYVDSLNFIETPNLNAYMSLGSSGNNVSVQCGVLNVFNASYFGLYQGTHYIEITGSFSRLSCVIWRKGDEIKIVGTSRKFDSSGNTNELIDFEVFRKK